MKALIIDLSGSNDVKILNTRITSSVTIISGYYIGLEKDEDAVAAAIVKVKEEKLADIPTFIIPSRSFMQSHLFHFPPMPDKEITKILRREIAVTTDSNEPFIFDYLKNGTVMEKGVEKMEVAAFYAPKEQVFDFLHRLKGEGLNPHKIIPSIQGLKTLMDSNSQLTHEKSGLVFIELMDVRVDINIFKHNNWGLEREFIFQMEADNDLGEDDLARISVEVNRTFQYFKQKNRQYNIDKALLYGNNPGLKHFKNFTDDNLPVTSEILTPHHFKAKINYPSHLKDKNEFLLIFTIAVSVAVSLTNKDGLNLFPSEFREQEKLPRRLIGLTISTVLILSILAFATFWFEKIKSSYNHDIAKITKTYHSLSSNVTLIESTKKQRALFYKKRFFSDYPLMYSYSAADFIRQLSLVTVPSVQLLDLEITPLAQTFNFVLTGSIGAADNVGAQSAFLRFFRTLKEMDGIVDINFSTIKVNAGDDSATLKPGERENREPVALLFTINGEIEPE
ncbi:MAG: hypothetical protein GY765_01230 [bacterium]|nr:hypothetical protein [bacterium]